MKLRALVLLLLVANLAFFAWTRGWLDGVTGLPAHGDREPERLARQVQPQSVRILPPKEAASAMAAAPAAAVCLEAGPFSPAEADAAEALLQAALPAGGWVRRGVERPGDWLIYLGRFTAADSQQKKAEELRRLQLAFDEVQGPPELVPGLSLGHFDNRAAADKALEQLVQRGVRSARVVTLAEPGTDTHLRFERADAAIAARLAAVSGEVKGQPLGAAFGPCGG
jgi:hypothetical protein